MQNGPFQKRVSLGQTIRIRDVEKANVPRGAQFPVRIAEFGGHSFERSRVLVLHKIGAEILNVVFYAKLAEQKSRE